VENSRRRTKKPGQWGEAEAFSMTARAPGKRSKKAVSSDQSPAAWVWFASRPPSKEYGVLTAEAVQISSADARGAGQW